MSSKPTSPAVTLFRRYIRSPKRNPVLRSVDGEVKLVPDGRSNAPRGEVVAITDGGILRVGWSLCNVKSGDQYKRNVGDDMAIGRAYKTQLGQAVAMDPVEILSERGSRVLQGVGVPQSATSTVQNLVRSVVAAGERSKQRPITQVYVYTDK